MGCDIHLHIEIKINDKWEHLNAPSVDRNYRLFTKMAGVRKTDELCIVPISAPKGLPEDISLITRLDAERWRSDGHSYSYLNADEIVLLDEWYREQANNAAPQCWIETQFGYLFGNSLAGFSMFPADNPTWLQDVRLVFWFDN